MLPITQSNYQHKRKFKDNIPSFGLILFYINRKEKDLPAIEYLIQERRDTFEYVEFMQGSWVNLDRLKALFSSMTPLELDRISNHTFDERWNDLYIDKTSKMYMDGYTKAKKKHEEIESNLNIYIKNAKNAEIALPWGFPKGRKNNNLEKDQECAIRETEEESRIPRDLYRVLPYKYSEKFVGSNGVSYSTVYYLCEVKERYVPKKMETPECIRKTSLSEEVSEVQWFTYDDACAVLNAQRRSILYEADVAIKKYFIDK
jgi:8-oxo-dGTP pyrophosphatase MutT (NUDIX family)